MLAQISIATISALLLAADRAPSLKLPAPTPAPAQAAPATTTASTNARTNAPAIQINKRIQTAPTETRLPVWVYFQELRAQPCQACETAITDLAVARRSQRRTLPGVVDIHDMPLPQECANAITATGASVRVQSRWLMQL